MTLPYTIFPLAAGMLMQSARHGVWLCMLFFGLCGGAIAKEPVQLLSGVESYSLSRSIGYLEDQTGTLTLQDILSRGADQTFATSDREVPNFGFTASAYWFKVQLQNRDSLVSTWLLELQYPMLDYVDVHLIYATLGNRTISYRGGDRLPFSERQVKHRNMLFKVPLNAGESATVLIRVRTDSSMQLPLTLWSPNALLERDQKEQLISGGFYGILIAMLLFNLMIYLSIRDINYLYYISYLASTILFQSSLNGLAFEYLWPNSPWWGNVSTPFFIGVVFATIVQFSREFLQLRKNLPKIDKAFKIYLGLFVVVMVVSLAMNYTVAIKLGTFFTMTATPLLFIAGALCLKKGVLHAKYFMLAWTVLLIFIFVYTLKTFGVLPHVFITEYGMQIGTALEAILLSFALAHRLRLLRLENESIQRSVTETLEQRVRERTIELDETLNRLADVNKKLVEMNHTDGLTGISNRIFFDQVFSSEWRRSQRNSDPISVLLLDIDHFKKVNDTYGHLGGDFCLKQVAITIRNTLRRPVDTAFRFGGEEFVVLLPNTNVEGAFHVAERIRSEVAALNITFEGHRIPITVSVGVASTVPDGTGNEESLVGKADLAMYEAKNTGRNRTCFFKEAQENPLGAETI